MGKYTIIRSATQVLSDYHEFDDLVETSELKWACDNLLRRSSKMVAARLIIDQKWEPMKYKSSPNEDVVANSRKKDAMLRDALMEGTDKATRDRLAYAEVHGATAYHAFEQKIKAVEVNPFTHPDDGLDCDPVALEATNDQHDLLLKTEKTKEQRGEAGITTHPKGRGLFNWMFEWKDDEKKDV